MNNNTILLESCLKEYQKSNELLLNDSDLFEVFSSSQITKQYELSFEEIEDSIVDGGQDGGIDSFIIIVDNRVLSNQEELEDFNFCQNTSVELLIGQSKFTNSFQETVIDKLIVSTPDIYNLELKENDLSVKFNPKIVEKILLFHEAWKKATIKKAKIKINYFYACKANEIEVNSSFKAKLQQLIANTQKQINAEVNYKSYSSKELLDLFNKTKASSLNITFSENPISVTYKNNQVGYIGVAKIANYYSFLKDDNDCLRENIFENNIRHYQGEVDVNKKIKETLKDDFDSDFWWLNNGITIIASDCSLMGKSLTLHDVQIVNGLQTSFTIGKYYNASEEDERSILIKIVINEDKKTIDKIIASTNRQNPVSPTLLRATEETQRKIELYFHQKGYFYDRRKNFYKNQGKPLTKIFSIQFAAQSIETILHFDPASARSKPTTLIKTNSSYNRIFDPEVNFEAYLNCCLLVRKTADFIKSKSSDEDKSILQNFTYHIARVVASILTNKAKYSQQDICSLKIDKIEDEVFSNSTKLILEWLKLHQNDNPQQTVNLISKAKSFVRLIDENIELYLKEQKKNLEDRQLLEKEQQQELAKKI